MKSKIPSPKSKISKLRPWTRLAMLVMAAGALFGLSGCYYYDGHGGHGGHGGYHGGHGGHGGYHGGHGGHGGFHGGHY